MTVINLKRRKHHGATILDINLRTRKAPMTDTDWENVRYFDAIVKNAEEKRRAFNAGWNLAGGDHTQQDAYRTWIEGQPK